LEKFFGLEVFIDIKSVESPDEKNKYLRCQAYIHLPANFVSLTVHQPVRISPELSVQAHGAQIIRPEWLQEPSEKDKAPFTKALRDLHLDVDVHPMSFRAPINSQRKLPRLSWKKVEAIDEETSLQDSKKMNGMEWPQRIQIMKMEYTPHDRYVRRDEYEY
jgi:hypothetical protein